MVLNDRSLTSQKDGLSNSLNLTNQDFYVPSPSHASLDFPPFLRPATQAIYDLTTTKLQSDIIVDV